MVMRVLVVLFALAALRRVYTRYRKRGTFTIDLLFWGVVFAGIGVVVFIPGTADRVAIRLGVSSGFNAFTFIAILMLLFAVFRLIGKVQTIERDLTRLVRAKALESPERGE